MPLTFDLEEGVGVFRSSGEVDYQEAMQVYQGGLDALVERNDPVSLVLFDLLESNENRSQAELRAIVDAARRSLGEARMALLARSELLYGLSRMFSAFAEQAGFDVEVFKRRDEALSWLHGGPGPSD